MRWGCWSVSFLVEWAVGRVFSTRSHLGRLRHKGGGPAISLTVNVWKFLALGRLECPYPLKAWSIGGSSLGVTYLAHPGAEVGGPPSIEAQELTGPDAPVDSEYQRKVRDRELDANPTTWLLSLIRAPLDLSLPGTAARGLTEQVSW